MQRHEHSPPPEEEDEIFADELLRARAAMAPDADDDLLTFDAYPRVPRELKQLEQWVNWHQEDGRKIPLNPRTLRNAGVAYENTWSTYHFATAVAARENLGIGFVLTAHDPYTCIDLDKVVNGRELKPYAREILDAMTGYVELSPSGSGLHVWVRSRETFNRRTQGIEIYSDHRWMTVTGRANPRVPSEIPDRTEQVKELVESRFPKTDPTPFVRPKAIEQDDVALWQKLFSTKNGNFMHALYDGDLSVVKDDHSRGVIMLANMLAVYTHSDEARMQSLLAQTKLVNDKWYEKRGQLTWIEFQVRDAIDFVHRRELARKGKEDKPVEANSTTKEQTRKPAVATQSDASNGTGNPVDGKGKPKYRSKSTTATKDGDPASKSSAKRKPIRKTKKRTS